MRLEKQQLTKPDGRALILYGRKPILDHIVAPSPQGGSPSRSGHFRFHPLLNQWVVYASHRQNRTFLPPAQYNPLAPSIDPLHPTEVPQGDFEVCVFENLFPSLAGGSDPGPMMVQARPSSGVCEVVVYTQEFGTSLADQSLDRMALIIQVWADRTRELGNREDVEYVFIFENKGVEVGATLHHPHGQIYAYPFVPPIPQRELHSQRDHLREKGVGLLSEVIQKERKENKRMLYDGDHAVAFMPVFARYSYEVWVAPLRPVATFCDLKSEEILDLARALKIVLMKFDGLWSKPFPYVMVWHQAPTDGHPHPEAHLHAEFYPPYRMPGRLKYLAGSELGAGVFTADTLPEERVKELQAVKVELS